MPRQRPPLPPRGLSHITPLSGDSFHSAHGNRRSMYPGTQARVFDAEELDPRRRSQRELSGILESNLDDEGFDPPIRPPRRHSGMHGRATDVSESDFGYGSRVERSHPSPASLSGYSLDPRDSISNRESSPSDNGYIPQHHSPRGHSNIHGVYIEDEYYDDRLRADIRVVGPVETGARLDDRAIIRNQDYSSSSSDSYSEEPRTPRRYDGSGMRSRHEEYDDEYHEPSTPRGYRGRRMSSRYDNFDDREDAYGDELLDEPRRNEEGYDDYIIVPPQNF